MEDKKFCKYCGEQIDKECFVCPKCGRQIININNNQEKNKSNNINNKSKIYEQTWFMWVMLIFFAPIGIIFMWKFHPEMKKRQRLY